MPEAPALKKERLTSQKKIVLDYLKKAHCHPSAEEVYKQVKKKLPQISKGTVYRILSNLREKGEIQEVPLPVSRYEKESPLHAHFLCEKCGRIEDVFRVCDDFDKLLKNRRIGIGKVNSYQIFFYGLCKDCQGKRKRK